MKIEMLNNIFSECGIRLIKEVGKEVFLIDYLKEPGEKQVLKVIDIVERAKQETSEKYSEETIKKLFGVIHGNELIWNEKITLTKCEYMVRILEDYIIGGADEEKFLYAIRMPYYRTLSMVCEEDGMDENKVVGMGIDICNALRTLHHNGTKEFYQNETVRFGTALHLDIKPDNIFLEDKDEQKTFMLGDFGTVIEKGRRALPMKTKGFYAPEMKEQNNLLTEAADIFMLGMVLYWCVCDKKEDAEVFWETRLSNKDVSIPANCSPHLWMVIEKATRTEAKQRFQSAAEMLSALQMVNVNKTVVAEVMKEKYENESMLTSLAVLIEAGLLVNQFLGKIKKRANKTGRIDLPPFGNYEGGIKDGNPHGNGKCTYQYGQEMRSICGEWEWVKKKKINSGGTKVIYTGMLCGGKMNGLGQIEIPKTGIFLGITNQEHFQVGTMIWKNGERYAGSWMHKDGVEYMHGNGTYFGIDGTSKQGHWNYGTFIGEEIDK